MLVLVVLVVAMVLLLLLLQRWETIQWVVWCVPTKETLLYTPLLLLRIGTYVRMNLNVTNHNTDSDCVGQDWDWREVCCGQIARFGSLGMD